MPPITKPSCSPDCGENAHCEYGPLENTCVCNAGYYGGNPYTKCFAEKTKSCTKDSCGKNAVCKATASGIECICMPGFSGRNPFIECFDIDECSAQVCAENAVCINTIGSFDCKCKAGYEGNPFSMCSALSKAYCNNPQDCDCSSQSSLCPSGFKCEKGRCVNLCDQKRCGPFATCDFESGQCVCIQGYQGTPNDLSKGCSLMGQCNTDQNCKDSEICFKNGRGLRKCVQGCTKIQCGPNSVCSTTNHQSNCFCIDGYRGNAYDLNKGCQLEERVIPLTGCDAVACGKNEVCKMQGIEPVCQCEDLYAWNPVTSLCEKPSLPECQDDSHCPETDACRPDDLGVLKCKPVCSEFHCPPNSICNAKQHFGECECLAGYSGNVNDRFGCRSDLQLECTSNAQCAESEMCIKQQGINKCVPACSSIKCGNNARCVTNNHIAQCQCFKEGFIGDPYDPKGCEKVPCVYNEDCNSTQLCDRMSHQCINICLEDSCGDNAVCLVVNRKPTCQCPDNFRANPLPEVECVPEKSCSSGTCHPTAICEMGSSGPICKCPGARYTGDPYRSGCVLQAEGTCKRSDSECPKGLICRNNKCINPCENKCGFNALCKVLPTGIAECSCPPSLVPLNNNAEEGCIRSISKCSSNLDCVNGVCDASQCKSICRSNQDCYSGEKCIENLCQLSCLNNVQCTGAQACINGFCQIGCRSNKECGTSEACIENRCQNPCLNEGVCGPNAKCSVRNHKITCNCDEHFEPNPTPDQGCVRVPPGCLNSEDCPASYECLGNKCFYPCRNNSNVCAIGERCINNLCSKVCYTSNNCLPGEICSDGICVSGCVSDADCPHTEICQQSKCKCAKGFIPSPNGCVDIDECSDNPCHPSAYCENTPGSYRCSCSAKMVGDAYGGAGCLRSNDCDDNTDCADHLSCEDSRCVDFCSTKKCLSNAYCQVDNHIACEYRNFFNS